MLRLGEKPVVLRVRLPPPVLANTRTMFIRSMSPSPTWKAGQGVSEEQSSWRKAIDGPRKSWNLEEIPSTDVYKLLTSAIVPRPIALTSSLSPDGVLNLAPFSYFSMVSSNPPMLSISFSLSSRRKKDTRENVLATKEFTVNIISQAFVEAANITSVESSEADEWVLSGLIYGTEYAGQAGTSERERILHGVRGALYSYQDITPVGATEPTATVVLGLIRYAHAMESVLDSDGTRVDPDKLQVVARMGGETYSKVVEGFDIARPKWKDLNAVYLDLLGKKKDR
ncbi:uncharacterized protein EV420DRAFT_1477994 [Desarmillaria tabescens]|uniref:Flavin reductase like domain-containing protein n=1 Tax=Armillaria tabescens TaxID=1929756 RepID=A0AA39N8V9_ARMTA|nr:uncharacterized protein EV420DRAFT_1477994 [Desarmillaria tabescens]KAK0461177.1 hypothetical protein EV420DRAFT_1477994 [Desarmillaria tabescens]